MNRALFIFRRDLRLEDNTGLLFALENAKEVILSFIFTPEQIENNPFRSDRSLEFLIESLEDLDLSSKGRLHLFYGKPEEIVTTCIKQLQVDGVIVNKDYTPYSIKRDLLIRSVCEKNQIDFHSFDDLLLHPMEETLKSDGKPYTIFTPYFRNASKLPVDRPLKNIYDHYYTQEIPFSKNKSLFETLLPHRYMQQKGGRKEALKLLKNSHADYEILRDFPAKDGTSHLSPHLKYTTCSPREVFYTVDPSLIRSLYWRDFFTTIAFHYPHVFQGAFKKEFDKIRWSTDTKKFERWCEGKTGFPIVDAGMRELNETGYMHNRVRMIVASFLVKDLHINWQWGEKYFAQKLIDYDPAINNGNWQWAASTGCDAQPYFRIFNPWSQSIKFDPDCLYIKKWIPELQKLPPKSIHNWEGGDLFTPYPPPMLDHKVAAKKALEMFIHK